jgi:hypothetical protein
MKTKKIVNACLRVFEGELQRIAGCLRQASDASRINSEAQERACARKKL